MDINEFVDRYVAVWGEPDDAARRKAIAELWAEDGVEITEKERYVGHDALEGRVVGAYNELVRDGGFVFRSSGDVSSHHDAVTFTVQMSPAAGGAVEWTGRMFILLGEDGLIRYDYQFSV